MTVTVEIQRKLKWALQCHDVSDVYSCCNNEMMNVLLWNYTSSAVKPSTFITVPTRCKLPVTNTVTGAGLRLSIN